jgi:hypothetical protein
MSTTSTRLTAGGKNLLTVAASTPSNFNQSALEIIFNEAIKDTLPN